MLKGHFGGKGNSQRRGQGRFGGNKSARHHPHAKKHGHFGGEGNSTADRSNSRIEESDEDRDYSDKL